MFNKHKDRLYLVLETKRSGSGYFWSILLAPADKKESDGEHSLATKWEIVEGPPCYWTFRSLLLSANQYANVVARLCVGKFAEPQTARAQIETILNDVPIEQDDALFRTRMWAMNGLEALRIAGVASYDAKKAEMERFANELANEGVAKISSGELMIKQASDIPTRDMRW
jgi:hypothetical protein